MRNLVETHNQIEKLQKQAREIKSRESTRPLAMYLS
jgi:hypothetical protein